VFWEKWKDMFKTPAVTSVLLETIKSQHSRTENVQTTTAKTEELLRYAYIFQFMPLLFYFVTSSPSIPSVFLPVIPPFSRLFSIFYLLLPFHPVSPTSASPVRTPPN
jgi:hypothetical protein